MNYIDQLYSNIENWLMEYTKSNKITISIENISIYEELLGDYDVRKMNIIFSDRNVTLIPIGTFIIGAQGRIDMEGDKGLIRLVLVDKDSSEFSVKGRMFTSEKGKKEYDQLVKEASIKQKEYVWKIATAPPKIQLITLNEDTFFEALMEVVNG